MSDERITNIDGKVLAAACGGCQYHMNCIGPDPDNNCPGISGIHTSGHLEFAPSGLAAFLKTPEGQKALRKAEGLRRNRMPQILPAGDPPTFNK